MGNQENTEQERAEDVVALLKKYKKLCLEIPRGDSYHLARIDAAIEQAARRAPVVQPDQLQPDAAKRAMEALQTEVETLRRALADCRDAFPVPAPGSQIEPAWMQAMGHAEAVPDYMRALAAAPVQMPDVEQSIQELLDRIENACKNRALAAGGSIVACGLVESKRDAIEQQLRQLLQAKTATNADSTSASSS